MAGRNKIEIRIAGKDYTLVGVESDEYIQKIGMYVDKKMNEIMRQNNRLSTSMAAVLTALNVADDFMKTRENELNLKSHLESLQKNIEGLTEKNRQLSYEKDIILSKNTELQLELAKREAELREVRNIFEKAGRA